MRPLTKLCQPTVGAVSLRQQASSARGSHEDRKLRMLPARPHAPQQLLRVFGQKRVGPAAADRGRRTTGNDSGRRLNLVLVAEPIVQEAISRSHLNFRLLSDDAHAGKAFPDVVFL